MFVRNSGCLFARFQKTQGRLKKNQADFWQKKPLKVMEATEDIKKKTRFFFRQKHPLARLSKLSNYVRP